MNTFEEFEKQILEFAPKSEHDVAKVAWNTATKAERTSCGDIANKKAEEVIAKNTYRGKVNAAASFAASMLEDLGDEIRGRE